MLGFIRRLFGFQRADGAPPGTVAIITIQGYGGGSWASGPASLVARDNGGASLLACQVEVGTGRGASARPYGAGADDFPEGDYEVDALLPAAADRAGVVLSGSHAVLRLRARVGEAAPPPLHGRAYLLIHGGVADPPADGSIRLDDADMARLLARLPDGLDQVLVQVFRPAGQEAESAEADTPGLDLWPGSAFAGDSRGERAGVAPESPSPGPAADTAGDQAAAAALAGLGFAVLSDQAIPASDAPGAAVAADAGTASVPSAAADWSPAGGEYGS